MNLNPAHIYQSISDSIALLPAPGIIHLVWFTAVILILFLIRLSIRRHRFRKNRAELPVVIGGWGTRGKSGTERKKAALFQALGFNVVSKTTGCEAMIIHAKPGLDAIEIPIYRPGNKASIWEQEKVVGYAAKLKAQVFLWECMALGSDYAAIMQHDWMHDTLSTISNTFPDHENVQGPSGMDVSRSMTPFIPANACLLTAEDNMLPVLTHRAEQMHTRVEPLTWTETDLFGEDVIERFPYRIHPRNLGLVLKLAEEMGVDRDMALKEIADNIVPDLGAFNRFEVAMQNRVLEFWNGMSANDRTSCLINWESAGFDQQHFDKPTWIATVVNNRDDRILRSREFAEILVRDTPAHLHILIGTNLTGFHGYIKESIRTFVSEQFIIPETNGNNGKPISNPEIRQNIHSKLDAMLLKLRVEASSKAALSEKVRIMLESTANGFDPDSILLEIIDTDWKTSRQIQHFLIQQIREISSEDAAAVATQMFRDVTDLRNIDRFRDTIRKLTAGHAQQPAVAREINRAYQNLLKSVLENRFLLLNNPFLSGDQIIQQIVSNTPPGFHIKLMGMQNIKGTGLDFAYRWIGLEKTRSMIADLSAPDLDTRINAVNRMAAYDDYGILDAPIALAGLKKALDAPENKTPEIKAVIVDAIERISRSWEEIRAGLTARRSGNVKRFFRRIAEQILELGDSKRRRRKVTRVMRDLFHSRISHAKAAQILHEVMKRQEGGWL